VLLVTDLSQIRMHTKLTPELLVELCRVHAEGKDYRNVTALRCYVHPDRLNNWLKHGASQLDNDTGPLSLHAALFLEFARIEGEIRASNLKEVLDTVVKVEKTEFADGMPVSKTVTQRSIAGITWYMERRWHQYRASSPGTRNDIEVAAMLQGGGQGLNTEAAIAICEALAAAMPPALMDIFVAKGWKPPAQLTEGTAT
jgi:hypothetical protein